MKKFIKPVLIICGILFFCAVVFFKIEEISSAIINFKAKLFATNWKNTQVDFSKYEPLTDEPGAWYVENPLISHACGGINGKTYTNSKEALELAIENGHKVIEIDLALTADERLVAKHDWGKETVPDYEEFMNTPIYYIYTALDAETILDTMYEHEDLYIVTDIKGNNDYLKRAFTVLVDTAKKKGMEEVLDRFVIQIYYESNYDMILQIHPFKNWIYTLYASGERDLNRVAQFCLEKDIHVVTMPVGWIKDKEYICVFRDMNIKVYTNTINDFDTLSDFKNRGVYGFYTDYVKPSDLPFIGF